MENTSHTPYREVMNRWPSERLFEAAKAIRELQGTPGWEALVDLLGTVRESHEAQLIFGASTDDATVSRLRGVIAGLKGPETAAAAAQVAASEVEKRLNDEQSRQTAGAER